MTDLELKQEYKDKLESKFKAINPYSYGKNEWDAIQNKVEELNFKIDCIPFTDLKEIKIDGDDYLIEFDEFVKKQKTLSVKLTSREVVIKKFRELTQKVGSTVHSVWKQIKFLFSIPALAFASFVFSMMIIILFSFVLRYIFPAGFSEEYSGLTESIIAAIIFVVLKVLLILDSHDRYLEENWVLYILKYLLSIGIWWTMFLLESIRYTTNEVIYNFTYVQWAFYLPFFWLGGITHEFFLNGIIGYLIITILPILIALPIILFRELGISIINKKNIEYKNAENEAIDDYDYHFDDNADLQILGNNSNDNGKNEIVNKEKLNNEDGKNIE